MRKVLFIVTIIFLGGLGLFSQGYTPVTFTADDEDYVWGNVHVGDIIEFNQPNNAGGSPTKIGIVFYINPEKTEGWAVELTNTSNNTRWQTNNYLIDALPAFSTVQVGSLLSDVDGYNNTMIIRQYFGLDLYSTAQYAAGMVDFKNRWYLPASGQLMKLYGVLPLLEQGAAATGFTTLAKGTSVSNARYWSSTQSSVTQAWCVQGWNSASSGGNFVSYAKSMSMSVRAVRTFKLKPSKLSYLWSPTGDTVPDITVTPRETTEYCVTVTYGDLQCTAEVCHTIEVNPTIAGNDYMTICENELPFEWNGVTFTEAGTQTCSIPSSMSGCDSIVHLHLSVNPNLYGEYYREICESQLPYTWHGITFTGSSEQTITVVNATPQGCDSVVTLHLIVNQSEEEEFTVTECDSYTWYGMPYTSSGTYILETETAQGCLRTETLHLTINYSEEEEFNVTEFDSYTWHGTTYTQSGTYYYYTSTDYGCPRTEILHLTIFDNHWTSVGNDQYPFTMTLYGVIQIDGVEQYSNQLEIGVFCGDECRGSAIASEFFLTNRYLIEANVYGDSGEQLTFKLYDHRIQRELEQIPPEVITFTIDGYGNPIDPYVLNFNSFKDITAAIDPEGTGTVTGTGEYIMGTSCTLTAIANTGFQFQNWTLNDTVVSTSPNYTFTVTGAANYVAHFQYVQSRTLVAGWNWWSTYIEQNGSNGLEMLENSLGTSGLRIQGKNNSVDYFEYQGTGYWYGSLNTLTNEQMYMIRTSAACDAVIVGDAALPSNHPITINGGWNWIGYPCSQSVSVDAAMAGFMPEPNDVIKGRSSASMYLSYGGYQGWYGQLNTLEPGQGYMYRSYSDATKTLRFQTGRGGETLANITSDNNVFVPNTANYADNMIVTAVIDMEGVELRSDNYELAAFAGNECRGSVKLMYVEPYDRYVALLMAYGEGGEELRFVLTDGEGTSWSNDRVTYTANGMLGTMTEPTVLHFGPMGTEDNLQKPIHVYPNPSKGIFNIEGEGIQKIEVVDIYGQVILSSEVKNTHIQVDLSEKASGAYLLRVVSDSGTVTHKLVNRK